jgi:prephenate dehydrogenase
VEPFQRVSIVGVGLIGGSLGMALRGRGLAREVVGVTRVEARIPEARSRGAIDRGTVDPASGVEGADLVVLAVPPDQVVPMARRTIPHLRPGALLTDVASVKAEIVRSVDALIKPESRVTFVGGHPMAGNEGQGIAAAEPGLFSGTAYLITPAPRTPRGGVDRLADLARAVGAVNRDQIRRALDVFRDELARLEAAIEDGDRLDALLETARRARRRLGVVPHEPVNG